MIQKTAISRIAHLSVVISLVVAMLSACGFQPRGRADLPFERIYIQTSGFSLFGAELRRVIQSGSQVEVMDTPSEAEVILKVVGERRNKKILSLTGSGSVRDFELIYSVAYRVTDNSSKDLVAPNEIVLRRDLLFDDRVELAKESEEERLFEDMQTDAVQQMLRRLSVVLVEA